MSTRLCKSDYEGDDDPKTTGLPNPRIISTIVHKDMDREEKGFVIPLVKVPTVLSGFVSLRSN